MCAQVCAPPARARESARGEKRPDTPPGAVCPPTPGVGQPGQALVAELGGEEAAPGTFTSHPPGVGLPLLRDPRPRRFCAGADSAASLGLVKRRGFAAHPRAAQSETRRFPHACVFADQLRGGSHAHGRPALGETQPGRVCAVHAGRARGFGHTRKPVVSLPAP